ncbi:MAG: 30S ribosome-binding factor RbfA [Rhodothalassiaceae bacterium]
MPRHKASQPSVRLLRVGETLRHALAEILRREEIDDPDLAGTSVTVTEVRPSPDLRHAAVYVEPLGGGREREVIAALNRHAGFIRGHLGRAVTLKYLPALRFHADESFAEAARIRAILKSDKVRQDLEDEGD